MSTAVNMIKLGEALKVKGNWSCQRETNIEINSNTKMLQ